MRSHSFVAVPLIAALALTGCGVGGDSSDEDQWETLRIASANPPGTFDVFDFIGGFATDAVYDSLLMIRNGADHEPWLAKSFSYNEDRTVFTMELRDDVYFTDGEHLNAEVVKLNIDLQKEGPNASAYSHVDAVVTGEYTVELHLSRPDSELWLEVFRKPVVSPAAVDDREALAVTPVGSGPYVLESNESDVSYTFVRNEDYWNPEEFPFDRIELTVMPDTTARLNALKSGQVDFAELDIQTAAEAEASGFELLLAQHGWNGLIIGDRRGEIVPALADVRVRRAIVMALDRESYAAGVGGGYLDPSNQLGIPGQEEYGLYIPELAGELPYDIEAARELLAEAGYPDGFDIRIPRHPTWLPQFQPVFEQAFADLGIRVDWADIPDADWFEEILGGKNAIVPFQNPGWVQGFYREDGLFNPWHNTDPETEALLQEINAGDDEERLEAWRQLTRKVFDEAWFAILAHEPWVYAFNSDLNAVSTLSGAVRLPGIQLD